VVESKGLTSDAAVSMLDEVKPTVHDGAYVVTTVLE